LLRATLLCQPVVDPGQNSSIQLDFTLLIFGCVSEAKALCSLETTYTGAGAVLRPTPKVDSVEFDFLLVFLPLFPTTEQKPAFCCSVAILAQGEEILLDLLAFSQTGPSPLPFAWVSVIAFVLHI